MTTADVAGAASAPDPVRPPEPAPPEVIRVVVADDHPLAQVGLKHLLASFPGIDLVGAARSGEEALELCERLQPHVVLMDLMLPGIDGVEATRRLMARWAQIKVLVLTSFPEGDQVERALRAGATGYLLKSATDFDLAQAIRAAYAGRAVLAPEAAEALAQSMRRAATPLADLSDREREVLVLMARGLSNAQISARLSITSATVKHHVGAIFSKLGVATRPAAIALAYEHHLMD